MAPRPGPRANPIEKADANLFGGFHKQSKELNKKALRLNQPAYGSLVTRRDRFPGKQQNKRKTPRDGLRSFRLNVVLCSPLAVHFKKCVDFNFVHVSTGAIFWSAV